MNFINAAPVWSKDYQNQRNILLKFSANLDFLGDDTKILIAADANYRLLINNNFVFQGPQRCGRGTFRYDELNITKYLKNGKNDISILVINYGVTSFEYIMQPGFLKAEVFVNNNSVLCTGINKDFICQRDLSKEQVVERYSYQRPFIEVWHLPNTYSENLELVEVENLKFLKRTAPYPKFNKMFFEKTLAKGTANIPNNGTAEAPMRLLNQEPTFLYTLSEIPTLYSGIINNTKVTSSTPINKDISNDYTFTLDKTEWQSFKLKYENTGFLSCEITCETDAYIFFTFDEILTDDDVLPLKHYPETANVIPLFLKVGKYNFIALESRSMQYLKVLCKKGKVTINNLSLMEIVNPNAERAKFESSDEALNRVYNAAVNTFKQNAVDIFMDCPSRERAGWNCDSFFTGRSEKDLTGESIVEKSFIENFFIASKFTRIPDGMLPMCYPSDELEAQFIPNWAMFLVLEIEEYIYRTNDTAILNLAKERLYKLVKYLSSFENSDGLLEKLKGWVFVEWSKANEWVQDVSFPSNMMYYAMLKSMARLYKDDSFNEKAEKIKAKIKELSFNGKFFRDHQVYKNGKLVTPEDITEVCQYYAFFTGIADKQTYPELLKIIADDFGAGHKCEKTHPGVYPANAFIGNYLRMEVLSKNGYRKQIISEIKDYFDYMAKLTGTLWENDTTTASCNHGFASHIVRFIFRDCLGINDIDETNKKVYLNNDYSSPENVKAEIPLKNGKIIVNINNFKRDVSVEGNYQLI